MPQRAAVRTKGAPASCPGTAILGSFWAQGFVAYRRYAFSVLLPEQSPQRSSTKKTIFSCFPGWKAKLHGLQFPGYMRPLAVWVDHCRSSGLGTRERKLKRGILHSCSKRSLLFTLMSPKSPEEDSRCSAEGKVNYSSSSDETCPLPMTEKLDLTAINFSL